MVRTITDGVTMQEINISAEKLREIFDKLAAKGCNPRWTVGGGIVADCPCCHGERDLMIEPLQTFEGQAS
jgi:hypothetical protein